MCPHSLSPSVLEKFHWLHVVLALRYIYLVSLYLEYLIVLRDWERVLVYLGILPLSRRKLDTLDGVALVS